MSSAEALSALIGRALPPAASISLASCLAFSSELNQVNATAAPSEASRLTIPSPIPREPPVTRATLPANDRPYFSVMSILQSGPNLSYWIILSRIRFRFLSERNYDRTIATNLDSHFLSVKYFLPTMRKKKWGRFVGISSNMIGLAIPGMSHYIATKMGIIGFMRGLANDVASDGITANAVLPGLTNTQAISPISPSCSPV